MFAAPSLIRRLRPRRWVPLFQKSRGGCVPAIIGDRAGMREAI